MSTLHSCPLACPDQGLYHVLAQLSCMIFYGTELPTGRSCVLAPVFLWGQLQSLVYLAGPAKVSGVWVPLVSGLMEPLVHLYFSLVVRVDLEGG